MNMLTLRTAAPLRTILLLVAGFFISTTARSQIILNTSLLDFGSCTGDTILKTVVVTNLATAAATITTSEPDGPFFIVGSEGEIDLGILQSRTLTIGYAGQAGANQNLLDSTHIDFNFNIADLVQTSGMIRLDLRASCPDDTTGGNGGGGGGSGSVNANDSIMFSSNLIEFNYIMIGHDTTGTLIIHNTSTETATVQIGTLPLPFVVVNGGTTITIPAGATVTVIIKVNPTQPGNYNGTLPIIYTTGSNPSDTTLINVTASVIPPNGSADALVTDRTTINFGDVKVGQTIDAMFTISNMDSSNTFHIVGSVGGQVDMPFTIVNGGGNFDLTSGGSQTVMVRFNPTAVGTFTDSIQLNFQAMLNGVVIDQGSTTVILNGSASTSGGGGGGTVSFSFSENDINFNDGNAIDVGTSFDESITVTNTGSTAASLVMTTPGAPFIIVSGNDSSAIQPGMTRTITLRFTPTAAGNYNGNFQVIYGPNGSQTTETITLHGSAQNVSSGVEISEDRATAVGQPIPNPAATGTAIRVTSRNGGMLTIELYDQLGRLVGRPFSDEVTAGSDRTVAIDLSALTAGRYYIRVSTEEGVTVREISLVR